MLERDLAWEDGGLGRCATPSDLGSIKRRSIILLSAGSIPTMTHKQARELAAAAIGKRFDEVEARIREQLPGWRIRQTKADAGEFIKFAFYRGPPLPESLNFVVNDDGIIQTFEMGPEVENDTEQIESSDGKPVMW